MLEDLPVNFVMEGNKKVYTPIDQYWLNIFNVSSSSERKYPAIEKVLSLHSPSQWQILMSRLFSQLFHIIFSKQINIKALVTKTR